MLTQHQKFHKASEITHKLASLASEGGMEQFEERFGLLKCLKDEWTKGEKVSITTARK